MPAGSQADQLFALRSQIFAGAVLDGTWEAAAYVPSDEDLLPPLALAVGVTLRAPAVAAADRFVANLEAAWPVHRSPFAVGRAEGVCLPDLNILPGFAPCFVATRDALVVGWNAESVRRALAPADPRADGDAPARLELDLELFERADEILSHQVAETLRADALRWPWRHVQAEGSREGDTLVLRVALSGGPRE